MGAAHVRPYRAASDNAFIVAMLDFPLLDSAGECFTHGLDSGLGEIALAFGVGACDFGLERLLAGMNDPHEIGLAAEVQQHRQGEAGELVTPNRFGLANRGAVQLGFGRGCIEAFREAIMVEMKDANRDPTLGRLHEFGNAQLERARIFFSGQQVINRRDIGWLTLGSWNYQHWTA